MQYPAIVLLNKARDLISDSEAPYRWENATMLDWLNEAQAALFEAHPEFFYVDSVVVDPPEELSDWDVTLMTTTQTGQKILINYVAYRCLSRDNEDPETMQMAGKFLEVYGMGV